MDLLSSLKNLVEWERLLKAADKVEDLERRIKALEARLPIAPPHETCPKCAVGRWHKATSTPSRGPFGRLGALDVTYACTACDYTETKLER